MINCATNDTTVFCRCSVRLCSKYPNIPRICVEKTFKNAFPLLILLFSYLRNSRKLRQDLLFCDVERVCKRIHLRLQNETLQKSFGRKTFLRRRSHKSKREALDFFNTDNMILHRVWITGTSTSSDSTISLTRAH